jgi:hypothetical protein
MTRNERMKTEFTYGGTDGHAGSEDRRNQPLRKLPKEVGVVCNDCALIPWERIACYTGDPEDLSILIPEYCDSSKLDTCRVCQFLERFFSTDSRLGDFWGAQRTISPINVCVNVGAMRSDDIPRILVSRTDSSHEQLDLQNFYPNKLDVEKVRHWSTECSIAHGNVCAPESPHALVDLRVLDCIDLTVVDAPAGCEYVALSYLWGSVTDRSHKPSLDVWLEIPRTIRHSIAITQRLGYRYLWVDRYVRRPLLNQTLTDRFIECIDQGNAESKRVQIEQMGGIYASAQLTLIAAAGCDPTYGLPGLDPDSRPKLRSLELGSVRLTLLPPLEGFKEITKSTWATRGWTLQEGFLSKRRLVFLNSQVVFVCDTGAQYEGAISNTQVACALEYRDGWLPQDYRFNPDTLVNAKGCLAVFSRRHLSFESDSLDAIVGALNTFKKQSVHHIWGVPFRRTLDDSTRRFSAQPERTRIVPAAYESGLAMFWAHWKFCKRRPEFPSWSPMGWSGPISWLHRELPPMAIEAAVIVNAPTWKQNLSSLSAPQFEDLHNISPLIDVAVLSADLRLIQGDALPQNPNEEAARPETSDLYSCCVVIPVDDSTNAICEVQWDAAPPQVERIKSIIIPAVHKINEERTHDGGCIIFAKRHGEHFERIGIAWIHQEPWNEINVSWHRQPTLCDTNLQSLDEDSQIRVQDQMHATNSWWRFAFDREEVIVLG